MNYIVTHISNGYFKVETDEGKILEAGKNLEGMIRYTYFEDFTLPPEGWSVSRVKLLKNYQVKIFNDIQSGKKFNFK